MKEVELVPQEITYVAFQFALFKRAVLITKDSIVFKNKTLLAKDIVAIRYNRLNKVAGNRIAKSYYKIEIKDKNNKIISIAFSHMVSQGKPEVIEKVYFDLLNAISPIQNNILNNYHTLLNSGNTIELPDFKINNSGIELSLGFIKKQVFIPWNNLNVKYINGSLSLFNKEKEVATYGYGITWNLKSIEDICNRMIIKKNMPLPYTM